MLRKITALSTGILLGFGTLTATKLQAHEPRENVSGVFTLAVGHRVEPGFAGEPNAFDLFVRNPDGTAVDVQDIELTVKALYLKEERFDARVLSATKLKGELRRDVTTPNRFNIYYLPTRPGAYGFHIEGTINGVEIGERFVCGGGSLNPEGRAFACVETIQRFPGKIRKDQRRDD